MPPLTDERDLAFLDWAETVTFRTITSSYDPQTLTTVETHADLSLTALIAPLSRDPTPTTAGHHQTERLAATFKREELPLTPPGSLTRILYRNSLYQVTHSEESPQLITLHAHRIPTPS